MIFESKLYGRTNALIILRILERWFNQSAQSASRHMLFFCCLYCWAAYLHAKTSLGGYGVFQISRRSRLGNPELPDTTD